MEIRGHVSDFLLSYFIFCYNPPVVAWFKGAGQGWDCGFGRWTNFGRSTKLPIRTKLATAWDRVDFQMRTYSSGERTKQALIDAAGELLAERGVGRVSTRAIAERAGENIGSIHYHFGSRDGLLKEVLRFACRAHGSRSLLGVIEECRPRLDDVQGQRQAVRQVVRHIMGAIFCPERPRWCPRVLYQMAQHAGPLRVFLREQVLDPHFQALTELVLRIRPEWTPEEVNLWVHLLFGPAVFHADHCELILERLNSPVFPEAYLAKLEQRLVEDAARALGLPAEPT